VWMSLSGEAGIEALAFEPPIFDIGFGIGPKFLSWWEPDRPKAERH